jgi:protein-L-isoaspartate(D-aspartate) O-methyltransferase
VVDATAPLREQLVDRLLADGVLTSPAVAAAFRAVPRHLFLPGVPLETVYADTSVPTKRLPNGVAVSSSSQPAIMAIMLEQLGLAPGMRVLEVGAGTGYNAALLAHLVGPAGRVTTVDLDEDTVGHARAHLAAAGLERVRVVQGDGALGWPGDAPYDRIVLTVGAWEVLPAWPGQLAPGGRLLLPLALRVVQAAVAFERRDGHLESVAVRGCGFMPLRGPSAGPPGYVGRVDDRWLAVDDAARVSWAAVEALLAEPPRELATGVVGPGTETGLDQWLALHDPAYATLFAAKRWRELGLPWGPQGGGAANTAALVTPTGLAYVVRPPGAEPFEGRWRDAPACERHVRSHGEPAVGDRLVDLIRAWDAAGRPGDSAVRVRIYPLPCPAVPDAVTITKRGTCLVVDWPATPVAGPL